MFNFLDGLRVIDLTTVVLGPYATQSLGDFGADVIKIESPSGDVYRAVEPTRNAGLGANFQGCNRNKRSVALDLKSKSGRAAIIRLIADADVLIHNLRPKTVERLGLSYAAVKQINPGLVYCVTVGFGASGPYADRPAYDDVIQAMSGLAHLNADSDGEPRFLPTIACDKVSGLLATQLILAAVVRRQKTGLGCYIGAPMFEGMVSFLMVEHLSGKAFVPEMGSLGYDRVLTPYRRPYKTKDGHMAVLPYTTEQWGRFLIFAGKPNLAKQGWVTNPAQRSERIGELYAILAETLQSLTTSQWEEVLSQLDVPFARVNTLDDVFVDEHLNAAGMFQKVQHPSEGEMINVRPPFEVVDAPQAEDRLTPRLGEHTHEILAGIGYSDGEIRKMLHAGEAAVAQ